MSQDQPQVPITGLAAIPTDFLDLEQVSGILGVSLKTVRRMVQDADGPQTLPSVRIGGGVRIHRHSLVEHLNRNAKGVTFYDPGYSLPAHPGTIEDPDPYSEDSHYEV